MLAFLEGEIAAMEENGVILEVNHIGYHIFMPSSCLEGVLREGETVRIHTYLHVKEDGLQLYGFLNREDRRLFKLLIGVNGIGPKAAMGILSALTADELRFAVLSEDAAAIAKAPGVGKKTAQKLILELKDKLNLEEAFEQKLSHVQSDAQNWRAESRVDAKTEAIQALVALGYSNADAIRSVNAVSDGENMDVEELLRASLKNM
ncbi:MAG: Holliday junction branch migration protein RuvA [Eubacteriales bacterium]|nr:Holliday junction branch migration protein RuvA [Eubacteriales bacterium]